MDDKTAEALAVLEQRLENLASRIDEQFLMLRADMAALLAAGEPHEEAVKKNSRLTRSVSMPYN